MIQKLKEILEEKSIIVDTTAGVLIILLVVGSYCVKWCCSSIELKMILKLVLIFTSSIFVCEIISTMVFVIKYTKKIKSGTGCSINEEELKKDLFYLEQTKAEFWCCVIAAIAFILSFVAVVIVLPAFGLDLEFTDDMLSMATDIVAVIGVVNAVAKNHCNLVIGKYVDKYWVGKNEQSEQRIAK